jgi:membrane-associated phospholipid phosphatase
MKGRIGRLAVFTVLPLLAWAAAVHSRGTLITPHCSIHPEHCTSDQLPRLDRPAVGLEVHGADQLSFETQGMSAIVAVAVPALWQLTQVIMRQTTPLGALAATGMDWLVFAQSTAWNGLLTETSHLVTQRGRPFVYADPARANDFSNYTSFYSGHTSFSAVATVCTVLTLIARGAPLFWVWGMALSSYALVSLTGLFRVLAGRHFPSDVLAGALMGALVAFGVARLMNRLNSQK